MSNDGIKWYPVARVFKWDADQTTEVAEYLGRDPLYADFVRLGVDHSDYAEARGNQLTTAGLTRLTSLITGAGGNAFNATNAMIGVGNGSTAWAGADVDLSAATGASNRYIQGADATPGLSAGQISANATYTTSNANFAWQEWAWGIATGTLTPGTGTWSSIAATSAVMLNRKVQSLGTKTAGSTWTLQATITLS